MSNNTKIIEIKNRLREKFFGHFNVVIKNDNIKIAWTDEDKWFNPSIQAVERVIAPLAENMMITLECYHYSSEATELKQIDARIFRTSVISSDKIVDCYEGDEEDFGDELQEDENKETQFIEKLQTSRLINI